MNADPRRPDKVQRYVPTKNHANGEDLTPDYMNILGQPPTTANAVAGEAVEKHPESNLVFDHAHHARPDDGQQTNDELTVPANTTNVIPTSPQYGVAIIPNNITTTATDMAATEPVAVAADTVADGAALKGGDDVTKEMHSTPSRNERFKVVKIASLEPFKRGRWKCMDYVDEAPPPNVINPAKTTQSVGNASALPGAVYLQTQSLPPQQIQQMLLQGGFTNGTQFFPANVPTQLIPQGQYFYPQVANVQSQSVPQGVAGSMPTQFINNQPYFAAGVVAANPGGFTLPQGYPNIQYVPIPTQGSAFVPTSQAVHLPANFQQSQSYSGQPTSVSQSSMTQNLVNGHAYPQQQQQAETQNATLPNQPAKNVIVVNSQPAASGGQPQATHVLQNNPPVVQTHQFQQPQSGSFAQPPAQSQNSAQAAQSVATAPTVIAPVIGVTQQAQQNFDASNVYTNPQFAMSVNSLTVLDTSQETNPEVKEVNSNVETSSDNADDPNKNNPVVNAIDNKIEQAMDLVKSHLMYTVREEVEVLKEKIAELMERIQQLETENNYLRSLIPKNVTAPPPTTFTQHAPLPQNIAVVNPTLNVMPQNSNPMINNPAVPTVVQSNPPLVVQNNHPPSQNQTIPNNNSHQTSKDPKAPVQ
ncbi:TSC22 domain family protein 2-like [Euwallacea fornicatus]|uniref:TSC22 domain family protein 2-like n=1 Tax=Euwallacea fornicatus TaxID=995702 RepID=UPI00338FF175